MKIIMLAPNCSYLEWLKCHFNMRYHCDDTCKQLIDLIPEKELVNYIHNYFSKTQFNYLIKELKNGKFQEHQDKFLDEVRKLQFS